MAGDAVRFFRVPGMGHSRGGPSTDQFDAPVGAGGVGRERHGPGPDHRQRPGVLATPGGVNADVPADWSATRTRPLCPYPPVARYKGGDRELAASFACER